MNAPDDDLERRLLNWARWKIGDGDLSRSMIDRAQAGSVFGAGCNGFRNTLIPTLTGEALETDAAVNALESIHRMILRSWYLGILANGERTPSNWTQDRLAAALCYSLRSFQRALADARYALGTVLMMRRNIRHVA